MKNIKINDAGSHLHNLKIKKIEYEHRVELANALKDFNQLEKNKGLIFLAGREDALLHSEPKMDLPRIFISILPGTEEEIAGLKKWRNAS